jgi:hypothetical protein
MAQGEKIMHISYTIYPAHMEQKLLFIGSNAEMKWRTLAEGFKMTQKPEDLGEKVKDMGFFVWYIPKGKRKPRKLFICLAYGAKEGSLPYECYIEEMKKLFEDHNVDVQYQGGFAYE